MKKAILYLAIAVLAIFGLLTLFLSTSVIFDLFDVREKEGNYVLFIVWSNFISSFLYLISVYGLLTLKNWTLKTLGLATIILTIAFIGFLFYIQSGGIHENKVCKPLGSPHSPLQDICQLLAHWHGFQADCRVVSSFEVVC